MQESLEKILVFVKTTVRLMFICSRFHILLAMYFVDCFDVVGRIFCFWYFVFGNFAESDWKKFFKDVGKILFGASLYEADVWENLTWKLLITQSIQSQHHHPVKTNQLSCTAYWWTSLMGVSGFNRFHTTRLFLYPPGFLPVEIYLLKVNNRNTRTKYEICSRLTLKIREQCQWRRSGVFIVNFEHILDLVLVFLFLTLSR